MFPNIELNRTTLTAVLAVLLLIIVSLLMLLLTPKRSFKIVSEGNTITISNADPNKQFITFQPGMNISLDGRALNFDLTSTELLRIGLVANLALVPEMEWQLAQFDAEQAGVKKPALNSLTKKAQHYVLIPENQAAISAIRTCKISEEDFIEIRAQRLDFQRAKVSGKIVNDLGSQDINYLLLRRLRVNNDIVCVN